LTSRKVETGEDIVMRKQETHPCQHLPPRGTGGRHIITRVSSIERKWQRYV
jgi:hypothetical protein